MAAVNKVDIKKSIIKSFADFSDVFVDWILDESFGYNEVRVIFDHYLKGSLKTQTTIWRTDDYFTVYGVHDETKIGNLKTKEFLSSIKTKKDLTVFLSRKLDSVLSDRSIRHITIYNTTCDTNIPDLDPALSNSNQMQLLFYTQLMWLNEITLQILRYPISLIFFLLETTFNYGKKEITSASIVLSLSRTSCLNMLGIMLKITTSS